MVDLYLAIYCFGYDFGQVNGGIREAEALEVSVTWISALVDGDRTSWVPYSDPCVVVVGCG